MTNYSADGKSDSLLKLIWMKRTLLSQALKLTDKSSPLCGDAAGDVR